MRLYSVRLVAAVALFAYVEASALESQPQPTLPETSGHGDSSDQTFPQHGTNTDEEERMTSLNAFRGMGETTGLFKPMGNNLAKNAQQWTEKLKGKSAREAFTFLKLHEAGDNVFTNSRFLQWKYFDHSAQGEDACEAMVKVLLDRFGIFRLAEMLDAAKEAGSSTKAIAIELEDALTSLWQHSNPGKKFDELGFHAKSDPPRIPLFKTWYKFATQKWSPEQVLKFLAERLDDFSFAEMLDAAKRGDRTKAIAIKLEDAFISRWHNSDPGIKFNELGLDAKSDYLLHIPLFKTWYKFAKKKEWSPEQVLTFLKARLDDFSFAKTLDAAKRGDSSTKAIAIELEDVYISLWQDSDPGIKFDELGLIAKSDKLLRIPLFEIWYKFATKKEWSPEQMVKFLAERLGDLSFAKTLDAAKRGDRTKAIAIKLEEAYISLCQRSEPGIEFNLSGLDVTSDDLLGKPLFETWYNHAKEKWSPIKVMVFLRARLDDFSFAKMLDAGKKAGSTEAIAIELEDAFISSWQLSYPARIFFDLGLDAKSDDLLGNPLFKTWYKFAKQKWSPTQVMELLEICFREYNYAKMLDAATKAEDTEAIATELLEAVFDHWRIENRSEDDVKKGIWLTRPFLSVRKMELGVNKGYLSVWQKYTEWRKKNGFPETATDSAHAL